MRNFLFGYGSLINQSSRLATGQTGNSFPVTVKGLKRFWCVPALNMRFTGLGVIKNPDSKCNGVIVEVDENELPAFDQREIVGSNYNYDRVLIPGNQISGTSNLDTNIKVWAYVVKSPQVPDYNYPIAQSYVDVILTGCLEITQKFAVEFISTTTGWEYPWINDRDAPRYIRGLNGINFGLIDQILTKNIPNEFISRKNAITQQKDEESDDNTLDSLAPSC